MRIQDLWFTLNCLHCRREIPVFMTGVTVAYPEMPVEEAIVKHLLENGWRKEGDLFKCPTCVSWKAIMLPEDWKKGI